MYASIPPPTPRPQNAAGPESGCELPMTISVSVTPRSWVWAPAPVAATTSSATMSATRLAVFIASPLPDNCAKRVLDPPFVLLAEQSLRPDDEHRDDDQKAQRRLEPHRDVPCEQRLDHPQQEPPHCGTGHAVDPPEHRRGEPLEERIEHHVGIEERDRSQQDPRGSPQRGREPPRQGEDALHRDAEDLRRYSVLRDRPHRQPQPCVLHQPVQPGHQRQPHGEAPHTELADDDAPETIDFRF